MSYLQKRTYKSSFNKIDTVLRYCHLGADPEIFQRGEVVVDVKFG